MKLGDTIKLITNSLGIKTCSACERRRQALNDFWLNKKRIKVEVNTDMYRVLYPKGSIITIDKDHKLQSVADKLIKKGYLKVINN